MTSYVHIYTYIGLWSDVLERYACISTSILGAILRNYDGKEATDNSIYANKNSPYVVVPKKLKLVCREKFLHAYTFLLLGGKGNYNCLSVACRNSCGFQRMLESPSIPTSKPS